jgi:uncharacterized protein (DUF2384 family)
MHAAVIREIHRYERCARLLVRVDEEVLAVGMKLFECGGALVRWLCTPARALGEKVPLGIMRSFKGRRRVAQILTALGHGNYL